MNVVAFAHFPLMMVTGCAAYETLFNVIVGKVVQTLFKLATFFAVHLMPIVATLANSLYPTIIVFVIGRVAHFALAVAVRPLVPISTNNITAFAPNDVPITVFGIDNGGAVRLMVVIFHSAYSASFVRFVIIVLVAHVHVTKSAVTVVSPFVCLIQNELMVVSEIITYGTAIAVAQIVVIPHMHSANIAVTVVSVIVIAFHYKFVFV